MTALGRLLAAAGVGVTATAGCQSACFNLDQPACVDRFAGLRAVAHRLSPEIADRSAITDGLVAVRGDGDLGTGWDWTEQEDSLVVGFPEAAAVGTVDRLRRIGDCPAASTRLLGYIPDDTLAREPKLQLRVANCAESDIDEQVLFNGPADFGRQVRVLPQTDGGWDLWVSAPAEGTARGAVWRFSDAAERAPSERGHDDAQQLEGETADTELGAALEVCGDLTGDGAADLAIGAPGFSGSERFAAGDLAGAVLILSPSTLPTERDWTWDDATAVLWGHSLDRAGSAIDCTSDVDGDGVADLVVSAPLADGSAGEDVGAISVVRGGSLPASGALSEVAAIRWEGSQPGERMGAQVRAFDLDGDEIVELIAGSPGHLEAGLGAGAVRVLPGTARTDPGVLFVGRASESVGGIAAVSRLGTSLEVADLNNDGLAEILAGAWRSDRDGQNLHAGEVVVWPGTLTSRLVGGNHPEAAVIAGEGTHQEVGRNLSVIDVDGDGTLDMMIGARRRAQ